MQEILNTAIISGSDRKHQNFIEVVQSYYQLTKPRIIPLLLITTAAAMWLASDGATDPVLFLITVLGGMFAAASAQAMNCIYDRDIDYAMERTRSRPIPAGKIRPIHAWIFAAVLATLSFTILTVFANLLAAIFAMAGIVFYMVIYTHLLKRHTPQNIVIGGAAGAIPVLVGWAAVTNSLSVEAWVLFAIVFVWTPPHFWALSLMIKDDYAKVGVPMLPVIVGDAATAKQIWIYTLLLIPTTLLLIYPLGSVGFVYGIAAVYLGAVFVYKAWQLLKAPTEKVVAKGLFKYSILYMMLLCTAVVIDSLPYTKNAIALMSAYITRSI
jgi:heme o synthase